MVILQYAVRTESGISVQCVYTITAISIDVVHTLTRAK